jgi:hypothetical protein
MGRDIASAFAGTNVASAVDSIRAEIQSLEEQMESVTAERKVALAEGDDKGVASLERRMTSLYDRLEKARHRLAHEVEKEASRQARAEEKAAERSIKAAEKEAKEKARLTQKQADIAMRPVKRFESRISEIVTGALFFNIVSAGIREMTQYFGEALKTNDQYTNSVAKLKGALLTAFQPIYEYVVPAIIYMIDFMTAAIEVVGRFFSVLAGKEYSQMKKNAEAMYNEAKGIKAVGDSAEKAKKQLMGFDEINRLSNPEKDAAGTKSETIKPDFAGIDGTDTSEELKDIFELVGLIATALLAWKIASPFLSGLSATVGFLAAIAGAIAYVYGWIDALKNGIDWNNLFVMFTGMIVLAGGLYVAFGPVVAAIALLITGIGLIILAMKEWIETGEISDAALAALVIGIGAVGIAIGILTGSWIPLLVAAVVALVAGLIARGDEIKAALNKFSDWLKNVFGRDWTEVFGVTLGTVLNAFFGMVCGVLNGLKDMFFGLIDFLTGVFTGNWKLAWQGICDILKGVVNGVIGIINGMIAAVVNGINAVFRLLSFNLELPNGSVIGWDLPQFTPPQIPMLAQGAVIPPNAPFMAVLGDQKHGTNIEAPADLIRQIIREELGIGASSDETAALLRELIQVVLGIHIGDETIGKAAARYNRRTSRAGGY